MNKERVLALADAIEQHTLPIGFNMRDFFAEHIPDMSGHGCGTTACIAGWAAMLSGRKDDCTSGYAAESVATEWLEISERTAAHLFYGEGQAHRERASARDAVRTLRRFAETGRVDWYE